MTTEGKVCAEPGCVALPRPGSYRCPIHAAGRLVTYAWSGIKCGTCGMRLEKGDFVTTIGDRTHHVDCIGKPGA